MPPTVPSTSITAPAIAPPAEPELDGDTTPERVARTWMIVPGLWIFASEPM